MPDSRSSPSAASNITSTESVSCPLVPMPTIVKGREAIAAFPNYVGNLNAAGYTWVKTFSNYTLCHKGTGLPTQAVLWVIGDIDTVSLSSAQPYDTWTMSLRLSSDANKSLNTLFKSGPFKSYSSPCQYSFLKLKASLKSVREDLSFDEEEEIGGEISADDPYPFTYNGCSLTDGGAVPSTIYDTSHFNQRTCVGVEVSILGYQMANKEPGYSVSMRGVYHLGDAPENIPSTPRKRKGGYLVSTRRLRSGLFAPDISKPS